MKSRSLAIAIAVLIFAGSIDSQSSGQTPVFTDDMSVGTGWTYSHLTGTAKPNPGAGDISEADFGFDYSAFGIPEAPNSDPNDTATSGLRLATNITGFFGGTSVAAVYEDPNFFSGQYTVQVDAWLNWSKPIGIGSTEHAGVYVGFDVAAAQATNQSGQSGAGLTFDTDGDCLNCDYILNKDSAELDLLSGQYFTTDFGFGNQPGIDANDGPFPALFPSFNIPNATNFGPDPNFFQQGPDPNYNQPAGVAGFQWVTVTAEVDPNALGNGTNGTPGLATFTITNPATGQSQLIGTVDNSVDDDPNDGEDTGEAPVNMEGGVGLTLIDFFNGGPTDPSFAFTIFDNVRVFDGFLAEDDADFDGSGIVDGLDFLQWQRGDTPEGGSQAELALWEAQYGGPPPLAGLASVPEPASAMLLVLGSAGWLLMRRRMISSLEYSNPAMRSRQPLEGSLPVDHFTGG